MCDGTLINAECCFYFVRLFCCITQASCYTKTVFKLSVTYRSYLPSRDLEKAGGKVRRSLVRLHRQAFLLPRRYLNMCSVRLSGVVCCLCVHVSFARFWQHYGSLSRHLMALKLQHYTKFLFVRDPFVRLISAFRNKFGRCVSFS